MHAAAAVVHPVERHGGLSDPFLLLPPPGETLIELHWDAKAGALQLEGPGGTALLGSLPDHCGLRGHGQRNMWLLDLKNDSGPAACQVSSCGRSGQGCWPI